MPSRRKSVLKLTILVCSVMGVCALKASEIIIRDQSQPFYFRANEAKWHEAPEALPKGAKILLLEGDPKQAGQFIMRIKLPANYQIPAHWNLSDTYVTVISGHFYLGIGDTLNLSKAKDLNAGSYARIPARTHNYAWCLEESIIQIHGQGPWDLSYVNPLDDPRNSKENSDNTQKTS